MLNDRFARVGVLVLYSSNLVSAIITDYVLQQYGQQTTAVMTAYAAIVLLRVCPALHDTPIRVSKLIYSLLALKVKHLLYSKKERRN